MSADYGVNGEIRRKYLQEDETKFCPYCGIKLDVPQKRVWSSKTIDHIIPLSVYRWCGTKEMMAREINC